MSKFSEMMEKGIKYLKDSDYRFCINAGKGLYNNMPDEEFLKRMYKATVGSELNLDNPQKLSEKLQWLKIHDRKPVYTTMVDKYAVKKYVADIIGEEYVLPALAVWDRVEDITIDELPNQFVLKCTHDSGGYAICKDKRCFDLENAKKTLSKSFKRDYFYGKREWPYKNVPKRIIAEPFIDSLGKPDSVEYKLTCFDGKVGFTTVCKGIAHAELSERTNDHYDRDFKVMPWYAFYKNSDSQFTEKPRHWDEMIELAEKLSKDVPYLRVDFYVHNDRVYFGEMTFYTWAGFLVFEPEEWDLKLGNMLTLPQKQKIN